MASTRRNMLRLRLVSWPGRQGIILAVLVLLLIVGLLRRSDHSSRHADDWTRYHNRSFPVVRVIDGDTIVVAAPDGKDPVTRVRLWGVDTPEIHAPGRPPDFYGPEAAEFTRNLLAGKTVRLELVPHHTRGKYGRLLAYVYLPAQHISLNEALLETGHAYADYRFDHPRWNRFRECERQARKAKRGLWAQVRPEQMPAWRRRMFRLDASATPGARP